MSGGAHNTTSEARRETPFDMLAGPLARLAGPLAKVAGPIAKVAGPISRVGALFERRSFEEAGFEVDGLHLRYERHGRGGRVLVFLHGLLLDAQLNRRLAADLAERGFDVLLLDLPGHGGSDKPRHASAHRMDSYAHYVVALLDHLGIDQAVVGGVSLGANVGLQVAVQAPSRVRGLILEMPVLEWATPGAALVFLPILLGMHYAAPIVRLTASLARRVPRSTIAPLDSVVSLLRLEPEEATAVLHGLIVGPITPTYEERRAVDAPALVIGHRLDFIHPFTDADHLTHQLPHATLLVARSILELRVMPDRLTAEIAAFLDEVWSDDQVAPAPVPTPGPVPPPAPVPPPSPVPPPNPVSPPSPASPPDPVAPPAPTTPPTPTVPPTPTAPPEPAPPPVLATPAAPVRPTDPAPPTRPLPPPAADVG